MAANPDRIRIINPDIFTRQVPEVGQSSLQMAPANVDLLRYRAGETWGTGGPRTGAPDGRTPPVPGEVWTITNVNGAHVTSWNGFGRVPDPETQVYPGDLRDKEVIRLRPVSNNSFFTGDSTTGLAENHKWPIENYLNSLRAGLVSMLPNPSNIISLFGGRTIATDSVFYDYRADYRLALSSDDGAGLQGAVRREIPTIDISVNYRNYHASYEFATSADTETSFNETLLPSVYSFALLVKSKDIELNQGEYGLPANIGYDTETFERNMTLCNAKFTSADPVKLFDTWRNIQMFTNPGVDQGTRVNRIYEERGDYFGEYAHALYNDMRDPPTTSSPRGTALMEQQRKWKNLIINPLDPDFSGVANIKDNFPMYCEIALTIPAFTLSSHRSSRTNHEAFLSAYANSPWSTEFMQWIAFHETHPTVEFSALGLTPAQPATGSFHVLSPNDSPEDYGPLRDLRVYDFYSFLQGGSAPASANISRSGQNRYFDAVILGLTEDDRFAASEIGHLWGLSDIRDKFEADTVTRSFSELLLESAGAVRATLFYKIEKWSANESDEPIGDDPIQSFYIPNKGNKNSQADSESKFSFIDTQIKYGQKYLYRVYSYDLVWGTEYNYALNITDTELQALSDELQTNPQQMNFPAEICVFTKPSTKLISLPLYEKIVSIVDRPPLGPQVMVVPYRGVNNKLLFMLQGTVGSEVTQPIIIEEADYVKFNSIRRALGVAESAPINFSSDDPPNVFEVFRLETKPRTYAEFAAGEKQSITAPSFPNPCKSASAASFVANLEPNKKYYYTFRSIDVHQNISNPSPIYEIEISYDGASPFLLIDIINIEPSRSPPQTVIKKIKKYLKIAPAHLQTLVNAEASGLVDNMGNAIPLATRSNLPTDWIRLGDEDNSLWGKTLKLRLTSQKTGKIVDFNIKFALKHVVTQNNKICK